MEVNPGVLRDKLLHQCRDTIDSLQADLDHERKLREQLREQFSSLKDAHSSVLEELYTTRAKADAWNRDFTEVRAQLEELQRQEKELRLRNVQLTSLNEGLHRQLAEQATSSSRLREALHSTENEGTLALDLQSRAESKVQLLESENERLKGTCHELNRRLNTAEQSCHELNERLITAEQASDRDSQDARFKYECRVTALTQELEEKCRLQIQLDKENSRATYERRLSDTKKDISDFYEEQLSQMRDRLNTLTLKLEARHQLEHEYEETLTRTRESETHRSLNWEERTSKYAQKVDKLQSEVDEVSEKYDILLEKYNELKTEHHKLKTKAKTLEGERTKLQTDLECLKTEAEKIIQERNSVTTARSEHERTIQALRSEFHSVVRADEVKQTRLAALEEERDNLLAWKQHSQRRLEDLEQKVEDDAAEIETLTYRLTHSKEQVHSYYSHNIEEYVQIIQQLNEDRARLAKVIEQLELNFRMKANRRAQRETA
jgi:chromosome segregation ATPase